VIFCLIVFALKAVVMLALEQDGNGFICLYGSTRNLLSYFLLLSTVSECGQNFDGDDAQLRYDVLS